MRFIHLAILGLVLPAVVLGAGCADVPSDDDDEVGIVTFALDQSMCVPDGAGYRVPSLIDSITLELFRTAVDYTQTWTRTDLDALCTAGTPVVTELDGVRAGNYDAKLRVLDSGGVTLNDLSVSQVWDPAGNTVAWVTNVTVRPATVTSLVLVATVGTGDVDVDASLSNPLDFDGATNGATIYGECTVDADCAAGLDCFVPPGGGANGGPYCSSQCTVSSECPDLGEASGDCSFAEGAGEPLYCGLSCDGGAQCPAGMQCINPGGAAFCIWP